MFKLEYFLRKIPESARAVLRPISGPIMNRFMNKNISELLFWMNVYDTCNGVFNPEYYQTLMLAMAEESDDSFLAGKIVADFGCGPAGSLVWAKSAALRIGIDILADRYADEFSENVISHGMIYLKSTEKMIPLPSDFVDFVFTLNALDHVDSFPRICSELIRVLKPGGDFIGSINLEEPPTCCEPQQLNEEIIQRYLLNFLEIISYRITEQRSADQPYAAFFNGRLSYKKGQRGYLWVRARKKAV